MQNCKIANLRNKICSLALSEVSLSQTKMFCVCVCVCVCGGGLVWHFQTLCSDKGASPSRTQFFSSVNSESILERWIQLSLLFRMPEKLKWSSSATRFISILYFWFSKSPPMVSFSSIVLTSRFSFSCFIASFCFFNSSSMSSKGFIIRFSLIPPNQYPYYLYCLQRILSSYEISDNRACTWDVRLDSPFQYGFTVYGRKELRPAWWRASRTSFHQNSCKGIVTRKSEWIYSKPFPIAKETL